MSTNKIANRLVNLLRQGQFETAQKELFQQDAISTEPESANLPETKGLDAILQKGAQFRESVENWYGITVSEPVVSAQHFAVALTVDLAFKGQAQSRMDEIIVYQVEDGKIKHEQFFY
ncbi:MAG: nuclear transport factor 2 family protein [Bacteroidota bacterium]